MPIPVAAIITAASSLASGIASSAAAKRRNQREHDQRIKEVQNNIEQNRKLRQQEDADKLQSLKNAGLNANLAYGGATPVSAPMNPASVENEGQAAADAIKEGGAKVADQIQQQPLINSQIANQTSSTDLNNAAADKAKAEAEKIRLENEKNNGANQASYDKLKALGVDVSNINVANATGYLQALDFADEYHTKGFERQLRGVAAQLDTYFKQLINTDESFKSRWVNGQMSVFDNMLTIQQGNELSNIQKRQDISLFGLKKQMLQSQITATNVNTSKSLAEISKIHADIEQVRANVQIAHENSYMNIFKQSADALRRGDGETFSYWNTICAIKSGQFSNWQSALLGGVFNTHNHSFYGALREIDDEISLLNKNHWRGNKINPKYSMPKYYLNSHRQINGFVKSFGKYPYEK